MDTAALDKVASSVRLLAMDAIQAANSGHPGMPLGCAEFGALLYGELLKHDPSDPEWLDRDRFVLSAGHGSTFLYSLLHLSGYALELDELKRFRKVGSKCAGHPERGLAPGVETTTGPLGQGIATAVGMALAETMLAARFNTKNHTVIDHHTWVLAGDGCFMEGVSAEAASLAGHLGLGKLFVVYDSNRISIDGSTELSFSEDVGKRFEAYGWRVFRGSMYDYAGVSRMVAEAKAAGDKPCLFVLESTIGRGAPTMAGSHKVHGSPLGNDEIARAKAAMGLDPALKFHVYPEARAYFEARRADFSARRQAWLKTFAAWRAENPALAAEFDAFMADQATAALIAPNFAAGEAIATRSASGKYIEALSKARANFVGGSADLTGPNATQMPDAPYSKANRAGRMFHFGIREHGMAAISNGIALHGGLRPFCATFLTFSDYLKPALRLSALMGLPVIYVLTHDSIYIGEDGPTHQPIEHLAALRAVPNLLVLRPADAEETILAWELALERRNGPTVLALSRQNLPQLSKADPDWRETARCGAYVVRQVQGSPDLVLVATGSEVALALKAAEASPGKKIRVVSMLSRELFLSQPAAIREALIPREARIVSVEAGASQGWERIASSSDDVFAIDRFGESGPGEDVAAHLGFTAERLAALIAR